MVAIVGHGLTLLITLCLLFSKCLLESSYLHARHAECILKHGDHVCMGQTLALHKIGKLLNDGQSVVDIAMLTLVCSLGWISKSFVLLLDRMKSIELGDNGLDGVCCSAKLERRYGYC